MNPILSIKNLALNIGEFSLKDINIDLKQGDYFILLGRSGAGKSLILEMIAGMIKPGSGKIILEGTDITNYRIQDRKVGIVFQDYAVFPHLNVLENICYPLKRKKMPRKKQIEIAEDFAQQTGILHLLKRRPESLSGGEIQRVALTRTLVMNPSCILLDEPMSALDVETRQKLRTLLRTLNKKGQTIMHVTHDYEEAFALGTHVGILNQGTLIQTGTLKEVFHTPRSRFVANLTGIKNFFAALITETNKVFVENKVELTLPPQRPGDKGFIFFRAEDVVLSSDKIASSLTNQLQGTIIHFSPTSRGIEVLINAGIKIVALITPFSNENMHLTEKKKIWVSFKASAISFIQHL